MLKGVEWGEYRLGDLFEILSSRKRFDANKVVFSDNGHPYIVRIGQNNGVKGYIEEDEMFLNEGNTIALGQDTATVYYQEKPYFTGDKIKILKAREPLFGKHNANFFVTAIRRTLYSFSWGSCSFNVDVLKAQRVLLPTYNGEIDYAFMECFVGRLKQQYVERLNAYLTATGLKDYMLTPEEKQLLRDLEQGKLEWGEYRLGDLFEIASSRRRFDANKVLLSDNGYPYVVRIGQNNGVKGYIEEDVTFLNEGNTIAFGQDTATVYYQEKPYFTGDKIKILKARSPLFARQNAFFVIAAMQRTFSSFSWGSRSFNTEVLNTQKLSLPTHNDKPDYEKMELLIAAVQKLVIRDVVLYAEREEEATRQV